MWMVLVSHSPTVWVEVVLHNCLDGSYSVPDCLIGLSVPDCFDGLGVPDCLDGTSVPDCLDGCSVPDCVAGMCPDCKAGR